MKRPTFEQAVVRALTGYPGVLSGSQLRETVHALDFRVLWRFKLSRHEFYLRMAKLEAKGVVEGLHSEMVRVRPDAIAMRPTWYRLTPAATPPQESELT